MSDDNRAPENALVSAPLFRIALDKEVHRSGRHHHPFALILFDVDRFGDISETHGYGVAELVLERLAVLVLQYFRQSDWVASYGPNRIAVLLPETATRDAKALAEGARSAVDERLVFVDRRERSVRVTVSVAVLTVALGSEYGEERGAFEAGRLFDDAEDAISRARARGGNTVETVHLARETLSLAEAAAYVRCSTDTLRDIVATGTLPAIDVSGLIRIDRAALEAYRRRQPAKSA